MIIALPPSEFIEEANRSHHLSTRPPAIVRVVEDVLESSAIFRSGTVAFGMNGMLVYVLKGTGILQVVSCAHEHAGVKDDPTPQPLTIQEMVKSLNDSGLSVSNLATIFGVTRPTVYSWLEGSVPNAADKQTRVETVFRLLQEVKATDLRMLSKVWLRRLSDTAPSIYEVLTAQMIDAEAFDLAFDAAKPLFAKMAQRSDKPTRPVSSLVEETLAANVPSLATWDNMPAAGKEMTGGEVI